VEVGTRKVPKPTIPKGASKATANTTITNAGFTVGNVTNTTRLNANSLLDIENTVDTEITGGEILPLGSAIDYAVTSPYFPPFFPPYFPPSFCSCIPGCDSGNITSVGVRQYGQYSNLDPAGYGWTCDGTTSYEYWTCGCGAGACPAEGGYNGALREGVCGYTAPSGGGGGGDGGDGGGGGGGGGADPCAACGGGPGSGCVDIKGTAGCV